jgi:LuxR family maltose regulon positive regulatory protein
VDDPPAATSSENAASDLDVLLATKLHTPSSNLGLVPRPRLAEQLDDGLGRGLILACAPAGYGKTALLADWARRGRRPVAWLSLDTADNDPARFWRYGSPRWTGRARASVSVSDRCSARPPFRHSNGCWRR